MYVPVLAHEVSHLIIGANGIWLCSQSLHSSIERYAWFGSALLAISEPIMRKFRDGNLLAEDIAAECVVPLEFVNLRYAVQDALGSDLPLHQHAANMALDRWLQYLDKAFEHPSSA